MRGFSFHSFFHLIFHTTKDRGDVGALEKRRVMFRDRFEQHREVQQNKDQHFSGKPKLRYNICAFQSGL